MLSKVLDDLSQGAQKHAEGALSEHEESVLNYMEIVRSLADGKELVSEVVDAALQSAGKLPAKMKHDVELLLNRRNWRKLVDQESGLKEQKEKINREIITEKERFLNLEHEHKLAIDKLITKQVENRRQLRETNDAKRNLGSTTPVAQE